MQTSRCDSTRDSSSHAQGNLLFPHFFSSMQNNMMHHNNMATLLDDSGILLTLPYDLTLPFARFIAKNKITNLRRFNFSRVYRKHAMGAKPRELYQEDSMKKNIKQKRCCQELAASLLLDVLFHGTFPYSCRYECDFDIVSPRSSSSALNMVNEAEVLKVVTEVLEHYSYQLGSYFIRVR